MKTSLHLIFLGIAAVVAILASGAMFSVRQTEQVLVLQFGDVRQKITEPGLHFKIPFIQQTRSFDSRILNVDPPTEEVLLSDQKRIVVDTFARYRITDMLKYFQTLGTEAAAMQRLHAIINSSLRGVLGKVPLTDVLSDKRPVLMNEIRAQVNQETARFGIDVVDVRIVRADLPEQTSQSIFARMRSEREREAKEARAQGQEMAQEIRSRADRERTVIIAEAERDAQIIRGAGDKAAIKIFADSFGADPKFYEFYRSMEAYRKALGNSGTTLVLSPDSAFFKHFDSIAPMGGSKPSSAAAGP